MVKIKAHEKEYYLDGYLKTNLDAMKKVIKDDWDFLIVVDGLEGSGKSVFTMQAANYCSEHPLTLADFCFTGEEFQKRVWEAKRYQAVVFDEAIEGMTGSEYMSMVNQSLKKCLTKIRQKNLFIFLVIPSFFELMKYAALHRSVTLFHVHTAKDYERGYFKAYGRDRKKDLFLKGKKFYEYKVPHNFQGRFTKFYVLNEKEYRKKKNQASQKSRKNTATITLKRFKERCYKLMTELADNHGYSHRDIGSLVGITGSVVTRFMGSFNKKYLEVEDELAPKEREE